MVGEVHSKLPALGMLVAGIALFGLGMFIAAPTLVNMPDAWVGAVLAVLLMASGAGLIRASSRKFKESEPK